MAPKKKSVGKKKAGPSKGHVETPAAVEPYEVTDEPGRYRITREALVQEGVSLDSQKLEHDLQPEQVVEVLEVQFNAEEQRVRARIKEPEGWISLEDTGDYYRWAEPIKEENMLAVAEMKSKPILVPSSGPPLLRQRALSEPPLPVLGTGLLSEPLSPGNRPLRWTLEGAHQFLLLERCSSSQSWFDDALAVEDIKPVKKKKKKQVDEDAPNFDSGPTFLEDLKPHSKEVKEDSFLAEYIAQAKELSDDCFHEDITSGVSKRGGWRLTFLVAELSTMPILLGFIVFKLKLEQQVLSIAKLAVPEAHRRRGYGRNLITWAVQYARKSPEISIVALSSLPEAVPFYQRIGFVKHHEIVAKEEDDDLVPGQIYMEMHMKKRALTKSAGGAGKRHSR